MFDSTDDAFEAALRGHADPRSPEGALVMHVRASASQTPQPNEALTVLLTEGLTPTAVDDPGAAHTAHPTRRFAQMRSMPARFTAKLAALSLVLKVALGASVALAAVGGAGAAGVLPAPAQDALERALQLQTDNMPEAIVDDEEDEHEDVDGEDVDGENVDGENVETGTFGDRVSEDAKDGGVDGSVISEEAQAMGQERGEEGRGNRPAHAGAPENPGSQADNAPAGPPADAGSQADNAPAGPPADAPGGR